MRKIGYIVWGCCIFCCRPQQSSDIMETEQDAPVIENYTGFDSTAANLIDTVQLAKKRKGTLVKLLKEARIPEDRLQKLADTIAGKIPFDEWDTLEHDDIYYEGGPDGLLLIALYYGPVDGNGRGIILMALTRRRLNEPHVYLSESYWGNEDTEFIDNIYRSDSKEYRVAPETITITAKEGKAVLTCVY